MRQILLAGGAAVLLAVAAIPAIFGTADESAAHAEREAVSDSAIRMWTSIASDLAGEVPAPLLLGAEGDDPLLTAALAETGVTPTRFLEIARAVSGASAAATQDSSASMIADLLPAAELALDVGFPVPPAQTVPSPDLVSARDLQWELLNSLARDRQTSHGDDR